MKNIKAFESFSINETYYNKDWSVSNITKWINEWANKNGVDVEKHGSKKIGSKNVTAYAIKEYVILIVSDKAQGAPRLNELTVVIGDIVDNVSSYKLKNALSISSSDGDMDHLYKMLDKKINKK